jgi:hypothetical protein
MLTVSKEGCVLEGAAAALQVFMQKVMAERIVNHKVEVIRFRVWTQFQRGYCCSPAVEEVVMAKKTGAENCV